MRSFHVPGAGEQPQPGFSSRDKKRLFLMVFGLLFVLAALGVSLMKGRSYQDESDELPARSDLPADSVHVPEVDREALSSLVDDDEPRDRVVLEGDGLDLLLRSARTLTPRHFDAMGTTEVDSDVIAELMAEPAEHRGQPFSMRGRVHQARTRHRGPTNQAEHIGRLVLEDGSYAYFLVLDAPDELGYVRVDGLFLKLFSDEDEVEPGTWIEAPLIVGPKAIRSYPPLGRVEEPFWALYHGVEDADLLSEKPSLVRESPFDALWHMMAYARDVPDENVDWDAAPELTQPVLAELLDDPEKWRGQPIRIPISRIQDSRVLTAPENPARIEAFTQGWIGNTTWKNVVHFKYPRELPELKLRDYAVGRGFFLHDFAYQSAGKGLRVAPVMVLQSIERFDPAPDPLFGKLAYAAAITATLLAGAFLWLVARDKRKSAALQAEILRRRRARRAQGSSPNDAVGTASP